MNDEMSTAEAAHTQLTDQVLRLALLPLLGLAETSAPATQLRQLLIDQPELLAPRKLRTYLLDPNRSDAHRTVELDDIARRLDAETWHHHKDWQVVLGVGPDAQLSQDPDATQVLTAKEAATAAKNSSYRLNPPA